MVSRPTLLLSVPRCELTASITAATLALQVTRRAIFRARRQETHPRPTHRTQSPTQLARLQRAPTSRRVALPLSPTHFRTTWPWTRASREPSPSTPPSRRLWLRAAGAVLVASSRRLLSWVRLREGRTTVVHDRGASASGLRGRHDLVLDHEHPAPSLTVSLLSVTV